MAAKTPATEELAPFPDVDLGDFLPRVKQVRWDHYYMEIALTVRKRANCLGAKVGAVLVVDNRIVSTGFNGTPEHFPNCLKGGCVRCRDRFYGEIGHPEWASDKRLARAKAKQLDLCICVHAEANAMITAARLGNRIAGATLYTTHAPCFSCLKEAVQAGVSRVVYLKDFKVHDSKSLLKQYEELAEFLRGNDQRNFEPLEKQGPLMRKIKAPVKPPNLDRMIAAGGPNDDAKLGRIEIPIPESKKTTAKSGSTTTASPTKRASSRPRRGTSAATGRGKSSAR